MAIPSKLITQLERLELLRQQRQPPQQFHAFGFRGADGIIMPMDFSDGGPGEEVKGIIFDPTRIKVAFDFSGDDAADYIEVTP